MLQTFPFQTQLHVIFKPKEKKKQVVFTILLTPSEYLACLVEHQGSPPTHMDANKVLLPFLFF